MDVLGGQVFRCSGVQVFVVMWAEVARMDLRGAQMFGFWCFVIAVMRTEAARKDIRRTAGSA